ncbi:MAG: hypothetical protein UDP16_06540, partial [Collinsella sp.]|nr:hypothetical protein [Collinsella sp.]
YNPEKYSMLKDAIDRGGEISNARNAMYENGQLTELGRIAQEAFQGAYNTDPTEFSALQDAYAYNSYYAVTESWLKSALGIDLSGRADCVKGMVWSITNMCGTGGCQDFFRWANLSNSMTDREFVTALSNSVVNNVATKYASQPQYHEGWKNRYRNELKDCLVYIAEDEAAAATPVEPEPEPAPGPSMAPAAPAAPTPGTDDDAGDDSDTDTSSTDGGSDDAGNGGAASGDTSAGDSSTPGSDGAAGGADSGSSDAGTSNGTGDSSADAGSSNGSDSGASEGGSSEGSKAGDSSTENKPSTGEQLGSMLGSSLMAGINGGSSSGEESSEQGSGSNANGAADASAGAGAKQSDADAQKAGDKGGTTTTATTKTSGGNMPRTGDLIVMASLASASLATLGATSIVSGKHKLDQQNKAAGEDGFEE